MATILVTGDTGFVGTALVKQLLSDSHRVVGVSRSTLVDKELLQADDYTHIISDIAGLTPELVGEPVAILIDLAWAGSTGAERGDKKLQMKNVENVLSSVDLLARLGGLLYIGTGTITELTALSDGAPDGPAKSYGLSKNLAHQETKKKAAELGLEHIWMRLGNSYSEDDTSGRFLNSTLDKLAKDEPVTLMTGNQPFDFIHLSDAVRAISLVALFGEDEKSYYIGNGDVATIEDFVSVAVNVLHSRSKIQSIHVDKLGLTEDDLSNDALKSIGYSQRISFIEGVRLWRDYNSL